MSKKDIKYIDPAEFRSLGYLQEINRRVLHPAGLAMAIVVDEDGTETFSGCWDYRDDPEGMLYGPNEIDQDKVNRVNAEVARHAPFRRAFIGAVTQAQGLTNQQMTAYEPKSWADTPTSETASPADERTEVVQQLMDLLGGLYEPAGGAIWLSAHQKRLNGKSAADAIREHDLDTLRTACQLLDAIADGTFA